MTQHDEDDVPEWSTQVVATVAAEVRRRRKEMGMSAQDLADACAEIGHPVPRNVIANMEAGRRSSLPLTDVMVLAQALDTSPICLIVPVGYIAKYQSIPLESADEPLDALRWFTGEDSSSFGNWPLTIYRMHDTALSSAYEAARKVALHRYQASNAATPQQRSEALRSAERFEQLAEGDHDTLRRVRAQMRSENLHVPRLPPELAFIDEPPQDRNTPQENDA
ncbi:XRE family transcriptional regulator [Streptomyces sp. AJS327]|uniref:helix-turn-helix domain-containing protein n=1 Tax=Streptomyces sp. AJS327 TaxID=2545265 RepID=UPI0015DE1119|nr:helix-turn-helix transcriptional regulator [Streptomyces sp. AJS327]MBA0053765.1 XRE family transcriptional regulator [Streptomyces sp. AJS327]